MAAGRAAELVGDCASDPPLGATARWLAIARSDEVVYGLGAIGLERRARRLKLAVRHEDAHAALAQAIARLSAKVELVRLPDAWPPMLGAPAVEVRELVAASDRARGRATRTWVTVAGAVERPRVLEVAPDLTATELVAQAGGAAIDDWVAVAGGAPSGRLVERDAIVRESLLLILPAAHEVVRRLRTPLADWLLRAASACEGCRVCTDACPPSLACRESGAVLEPHALLCTLASGRDDGIELGRSLACTGCGLCDAMCPSALSPRALVVDVRDRLRAGGASAKATATGGVVASGLDTALLTRRLGLQRYDRPLAR